MSNPYFSDSLKKLMFTTTTIIIIYLLIDTYFNIQRRRFTSHFSIWTDIQPQIHTDCVDMVFLIDKSVAFFNYIFSNTVQELPEEGYSCKNRSVNILYIHIFHIDFVFLQHNRDLLNISNNDSERYTIISKYQIIFALVCHFSPLDKGLITKLGWNGFNLAINL